MKPIIEAPGAANAFAWSLLNTALSRLGTLAIGILLARLLGPESFGNLCNRPRSPDGHPQFQ